MGSLQNFLQSFPLVALFWILKIGLLGVFFHRVRLYIASRKKKHSLQKIARIGGNLCRDLSADLKPNSDSKICIQVPLFNESGHVFELLECLVKQDWPHLEIQVLDDSTQESCFQETCDAVNHWQSICPHIPMKVLRRTKRTGFKAGALNAGLKQSTAKYFAIFDCDFRPAPNFITKLMQEFASEPNCAAVQAPWAFYNANENMLTRLQSVLLGNHFHVEHLGRENKKWFLNFNGTAGIWQRGALENLGGWSAETVTEDLHLSLRSHLVGNRVRYTNAVSCPSELPATLEAFLVQQRRWAKGHGQVLRMMFKEIWRSENWSLSLKWDASLHLCSYFLSSVFFLAVFLLPFWIQSNTLWIESTAYNSIPRLFDFSLWIVFFGCFWFYYMLQTLSPSQNFKQRFVSSLAVVHSAPFISLLVFPSFFVGLFSQNKKELVFHRTPKRKVLNRAAFKWSFDDTAILCLLGYLLFCAGLSFQVESYFCSFVLFVNVSFAGAWFAKHVKQKFWKKEDEKMNSKFRVAVCAVVKTPGLSPVKTRLAKIIGKNSAEAFYARSLKSIKLLFKKLESDLGIVSYFAVAEQEALQNNFWKSERLLLQVEGGLGEKLSAIYDNLLKTHDAVMLIGGDMPHLTVEHVSAAYKSLAESISPFVLGPTTDGGYYLFGGRKSLPREVFTSVSYSQATTREQFTEQLEVLAPVRLLEMATDVDEHEDLEMLKTHWKQGVLPAHCLPLADFLGGENCFAEV